MDLTAYVDWGEVGGIMIGFGLMVIVPVVYMLIKHQQKMAELLHGGSPRQDHQSQLDRLEGEVGDLKARINHLIIAVENQPAALQERIVPPAVPDRLK